MKRISLLVSILMLVLSPVIGQQSTPTSQRTIQIDCSRIAGPLNTQFKTCIGAGRANEGLRADWQQQLAMVHRDCGFRYIRMHGLLTDDMGVYGYDGDGKLHCNFQYIDPLFDYILNLGMKPFVELGFMPKALASGDKTIFWWEGNVTPPNNYENWAELIRQLVLHFTERYGADEVKNWYFEVWNEPNLDGFWAGTQDEYFKLYDYTARTIKQINPAYRVGGPATAGAAWVPETISFCSENNVPIDFISTHTYGVKHGYLDEFGTSGTILNKEKWSVSGDVLNSRKQIKESSMPGLELHYTEWSSSYTPADPIHDSYHQAAYILQKLKETGDAANSMSYWVFTDIFEEAGPRYTPFHGGFGLLNLQGLKKPAYFAYEFLNQLGETELANTDSSSWACQDANGNVQLLIWDFTNTHPGDSVLNQTYYLRDLPAKNKGEITIEMNAVPAGNYQLEISQVGYRINDCYTTFLDWGRPNQLSRKQVDELNKLSNGQPVKTETVTIGADGHFNTSLPLRENDVFLLKLNQQ